MKLAVMQPYFFPYIGYFQAINAVDKYIVYDDLNYIYQGWVDRNRLVDKSGTVFYIRPQLINASVSSLISEIELHPKQFWRKKLLKTLSFTYAGADSFKETFNLIQEILLFETNSLSNFNFHAIKKIADYLEIKTQLVQEKTKYKNLEEELRTKRPSSNSEEHEQLETKLVRALEICTTEKATVFINAFGGQLLYKKEDFKKNGIDLFFIETKPYNYKQFTNTFYPHLSIIDVLMHNGKEKTQHLLNNYTLI